VKWKKPLATQSHRNLPRQAGNRRASWKASAKKPDLNGQVVNGQAGQAIKSNAESHGTISGWNTNSGWFMIAREQRRNDGMATKAPVTGRSKRNDHNLFC
jgi:hypothetical protein